MNVLKFIVYVRVQHVLRLLSKEKGRSNVWSSRSYMWLTYQLKASDYSWFLVITKVHQEKVVYKSLDTNAEEKKLRSNYQVKPQEKQRKFRK